MIGDRYEETDAAIAYRNLVEGEDWMERKLEEQEERTQLAWEQRPADEPDADDEIDAAVLAVELEQEAEAEDES